jgi:N-acetylglucosamine malate deacetylase 1
MTKKALDILFFGAHPDDVECAAAGMILRWVAMGLRIGIVDLTAGELGSRGTAQTRFDEAAAAATMLGLTARANLGLPDGFLNPYDRDAQLKIIQTIRKYKPRAVVVNALHDRHPDHAKAADLVRQAAFLSGLIKIETVCENGAPQKAHRPSQFWHYGQDYAVQPTVVVDITAYMAKKLEVIGCYKTQFYQPDECPSLPQTPISSPEIWDLFTARAAHYGRAIGVQFGEPLTSTTPIALANLF